MTILQEILSHNREFVALGEGRQFATDKFPSRQIAILSCMDVRMTAMLPNAMGLKDDDAKIIKNAGAVVSHPWGSVMRSLLLAVYELGVKEIFVVAHHDCGMRGLSADQILDKARANGISQERIDTLFHSGINLTQWLHGFDSVEDSVRNTVATIRKHPLMPQSIAVHGLVIHPETGKLSLIENGDTPGHD